MLGKPLPCDASQVCFDLKHCLLVRLTYKKAELAEELRPKSLGINLAGALLGVMQPPASRAPRPGP